MRIGNDESFKIVQCSAGTLADFAAINNVLRAA
jgi:hypothetical protein